MNILKLTATTFAFYLFLIFSGGHVHGQDIVINEVMSSNLSSIMDVYEPDYTNCPVSDCYSWYQQLGDLTYDGDYPDWIEIYNFGKTNVNLEGFGLSDSPENPFKWFFPNIEIKAGGYLIVFASGKDKKQFFDNLYLHTNFKISRQNEIIALTNQSGELLSEVNVNEIPIDMSLGRIPNQLDKWAFFTDPTPGKINESDVFIGYTDKVSTSYAGGFYNQSINLNLSSISKEAIIYYTLDGSNPSPLSKKYSSPIQINTTTVIKAQTFENGIKTSEISLETYFLNENFSMPVVSLTTPPDNLWDDELGIYTAGNNSNEGNRIANYWKDWERPCSIEYYDKNGNKEFDVDLGMKIFGWGSRANSRKSISLFARNKYGHDDIEYQVFPDLDINKFNSLVLRASGSDWQGTLFRDPMISSLVSNKDIDSQALIPVILYINGEYWGIYNLREKLNEDYLASHHGIDSENVDIISQYWRRDYPVVIEGDDEGFNSLISFIDENNIRITENYNYVKSQIDIDNFIEYNVTEIYAANFDWPGNNSKCWRSKTEGSKWRWLLYDLDYAFGSNNQSSYTHNTIDHATSASNFGWPSPPHTTFLLREMLENDEFKKAFINRFADFLNTVFIDEIVKDRIDYFEAIYSPEIEKHIKKWGINNNTNASLYNWKQNIDVLTNFAEERPDQIREHIQQFFDLGSTANINLEINPPEAGKIKLNSITIYQPSWQGIYFEGVPVQITVIPNPGYRFTSWDGLSTQNEKTPFQMVNLSGGTTIVANFETDNSAINTIVTSEIYYSPTENSTNNDWIELHSTYSIPIDISGWILKDNDFSHRFEFPSGTILQPYGYLVVCQNTNGFNQAFPNVDNTIGNLNFGYNSITDQVLLLDENQRIVDLVNYTNKSPWPAPNSGNSISLLSPELDNSLGENWYSNNNENTPGAKNGIWMNIQSENVAPGFLCMNYPNPFTQSTVIKINLPDDGHVSLLVFNISGQLIKTLCNENRNEGEQSFLWNGDNNSGQKTNPGVYFYHLTIGKKVIIGKMLLVQ